MRKLIEPILWSLFAGGGALAAFFVPVLIVITGIVLPFGLAGDEPFEYERLYGGVSHPMVKIGLFLLISLSFFHWAHRFLFTLVHMGLHKARSVISILSYGAAVVGTVLAAIVLWQF